MAALSCYRKCFSRLFVDWLVWSIGDAVTQWHVRICSAEWTSKTLSIVGVRDGPYSYRFLNMQALLPSNECKALAFFIFYLRVIWQRKNDRQTQLGIIGPLFWTWFLFFCFLFLFFLNDIVVFTICLAQAVVIEFRLEHRPFQPTSRFFFLSLSIALPLFVFVFFFYKKKTRRKIIILKEETSNCFLLAMRHRVFLFFL